MAAYKRRAELHGHPCAKLCWNSEYVIDWNAEGLYKLLPAVPKRLAVNDYHKHRYDSVSIGGGGVKVSLGKYGTIVDANWRIEKNWDFGEAELVDEDGSYGLKLATFFSADERWKAYVEPEFAMVAAVDRDDVSTTPKGKKAARQMVRRATPVTLSELFSAPPSAQPADTQADENQKAEGQDILDAAAAVVSELAPRRKQSECTASMTRASAP